jgi:diguanylate cyclase (GGDEF)-like protein
MSELRRRLASARHLVVMVALLALTLAALALEHRAVERTLHLDRERVALERTAERLSTAMAAEPSARPPAVVARRWTALHERVGGLADAATAGALARAALVVHTDLMLRRAGIGDADHRRALLDGALVDLRGAVAARVEAERVAMLHRHRVVTVLVVVLLAVEVVWLVVPSLRRASRAETDAHAAHARLAYLAHHDELTGLANRRALEHHLSICAADPAARFGVILCDLDGFKPINDVYGHEAGDVVLKRVAERLRRCLRPDDVAARLGGDEFVLLVRAAGDAGALATVAERVRHGLAEPVVHGEHQLRFAASLGTAVFPTDGATPHALLSAADAAMYEAKQAGGMGVRAYTRRLRERDERRQAIVHDLETALDEGELSVVFQPQIDLATGAHVGFEALTRWPSRSRGEVPPNVFIPVAESAGLLPPLTRWLVGEIERVVAAWRRAGLEPVSVSLNVAGGALVRDDMLADLARAAAGPALGGGRLGIEFTEDVVFGRNADAVLDRLRLLQDRGVLIAIDDFGTGYASLGHIGRVPFDRLKIAAGFVHQLGVDAHAAAVVRTIVELAQRMGGRAVATAVETDAQLRFLRAHGCDEAQGYAIALPLGAKAATTYLHRHRGCRDVLDPSNGGAST